MSTNLILTTGIYDLIKEHVRTRKVTKEQEEILLDRLRNAKQVLRKELPDNIVTIDRKIKVKDITENEDIEITLVAPSKAKLLKKRISILSDIGLATLGKSTGETIEWPTLKGNKTFQILEVNQL